MRRQGRYLDVDSSFGRRLSALRKAKKLSQAKFASKIGATQRMVSNYERSQGRPRADLVGKMAKALDMSVEDLLKLSLTAGVGSGAPQQESTGQPATQQ